MTLRDLAWKNIRFRLRSLFSFVCAAAFGAWIYFVFTSLKLDPALKSERYEIDAALGTIQVMVIAVAVVTILNALTALLRGRGRELGLLQVQGMGGRDLGRMLAWETLLLGVGATGIGVLVGILTGKLIYLGFSYGFGLAEPLPFTIRPVAVLQTLLIFGLLFSGSGLWAAWRMGRQSVVQLMQAESRRDGLLQISWWQVLLCLIAYGVAGYVVIDEPANVAGERLLVLVLSLAVGTYLFYVQGGVALLSWMRRRSFYWRGTNPILLAGLGHRMRSNARLLWLVTALAALTITMTGLITGLTLQIREGAEEGLAVDALLVAESSGAVRLSPEQVRTAMTEAGIRLLGEATITIAQEATEGGVSGAIFVSRSDWERWRAVRPELPALPETGLLLVLGEGYGEVPEGPALPWLMEGLPAPLRHESAVVKHGKFIYGRVGRVITAVLPDAEFARLANVRPSTLTGWRQADWFGQARLMSQVVNSFGPPIEVDRLLTTRGEHYWYNRQGMGMLFFLFGNTGLLFFLSSGAILAFRLFMEAQADRQRFARLSQIGLSPRETAQLIRREAALLFLTPLLLAGVYAGGAIGLVGTLSKMELWPGVVIAFGVYALLQLIYLRISTVAYRRAVSQA